MPAQQHKPTGPDRFFVNRENYFEIFNKAVSTAFSNEYSVLYFYGIGGVGKTRLRKELSKKIKINQNEYITVSDSLNFQQPKLRSPNSALYSIYNDLKKHGVDFPAFEIAYAVHWQKLYPQSKLSESSLPFLDEGSIVSDFISVLGDLPLVSLIPKTFSIFSKIKKSYSDWWIKKGQNELSSIDLLEAYQIEELLPYYFALDLKEYYISSNKVIIFFIDTYEALWAKQNERKSEIFFTKDKWIRTLIANLPHTLWVIFGRERLRWDEIEDDNWGDYIAQHSLNELSFEYANEFLEKCGVIGEEIIKQIVQVSKGLPFYLDLQVDSYQKIINKGSIPKLNDIPKKHSDILSRFCLYLEPSEIETLKILSFARIWKYELFIILVKEFQTGYPVTSFSELLKFSFINYSKDNDSYSIHQIMQEHLQSSVSEEQKKHINKVLFEYYNNSIDKVGADNKKSTNHLEFDTSILFIINEAIFHKKEYDTIVVYYTWLLSISRRMYGNTSSDLLQDSLQKAFDLDFNTNASLLINISSEIARLYSWKNNFPLTEKYILLGLKLYDRVSTDLYQNDKKLLLKNEPFLEVTYVDLLIQKADLYNDLDKNIESFFIYQQAFSIASEVGYYPNKWTYATLLLEIGRLPEAEAFFYQSLKNSIDTNDEELLALTYTKLAQIFYLQNLYEEANAYYKKSMNIYLRLKGQDHIYYWICKKRYAESIFKLGRTEEAKLLLIDALNWYVSKYGKDNPDNGHILLALSRCRIQEGDLFDGLNDLLLSMTLLRSKYGFNNASVIESTLFLFSVIQNLSGDSNALKESGFSEVDCNKLFDIYDSNISVFEAAFTTNFDNFKMNFGLDSIVLNMCFDVIGQYYIMHNMRDKKNILDNRKLELNRISKSQFQIRALESETKIKIIGEDKNILLEKFKKYFAIDEKNSIEIYRNKLDFYNNSILYTFEFSDKIIKHIFEFKDEILFLDWTNSSIYSLGEKDFNLSPQTVKDYVMFFFDAVKSGHGKFYFPSSVDDIPYRLDLEVASDIKESIKASIAPLTIIECTDDFILLSGMCFFKDSLFTVKVKVYKNGKTDLSDEQLVLENIPVAIDPQINKTEISYEFMIERILFFIQTILKMLLTTPSITEEDIFKLQSTVDNVALINKNQQNLAESEVKLIIVTLTDALYFIDTYIKPAYDDYLFEKDIKIFTDFMFKILDFHRQDPK